jgi:hypothetical protein
MTYESLESAITDRVRSITGLEVIPVPENDAGWVLPQNQGKVTVVYGFSSFEESETIGSVIQVETLSFTIVFWSWKLRGPSGIYTLIGQAQAALQGWEPVDCEKMYLGTVKFDSHEKDLWTYSMIVTTKTVRVEQPDPKIPLGTATDIKLKDPQGTIRVEVTEADLTS